VASGSPLVEPIKGDRQRLLVTFIWRPGGRPRDCSVYSTVSTADASGDWKEGTRLRSLDHLGVWYRSFRLHRGTRLSYGFAARAFPDPFSPRAWLSYQRRIRPDPENPRRLDFPRDPDVPHDIPLALSVLELPGTSIARWAALHRPSSWREDVHRFRSRLLRNERTIWVSSPTVFNPGSAGCNVLLVFDGFTYRTTVPTPRIVENLVTTGQIGPTIAVFIGTGPEGRERELACQPAFADFLALELMPWLRRTYNLHTRPSRTVVAGSSLGGVMAAYAGMRYPHEFGRVLAQSGAFQSKVPGHESEDELLTRQYALAPRQPLEFYLDAGKLETAALTSGGLSILTSVRHFRDVLEARGYRVNYFEFEGGHDYVCWTNTLARGILALLARRSVSRR
jgi:enterochelin esterase-like enzyme